ncbi:hypothetical protein [Streptomyces sp. SCL15-6]|nr:hypothetical protein [Streptomyces sp. SCL15-6]
MERTFAHLHWFRRLRIRWEIRDDIHSSHGEVLFVIMPEELEHVLAAMNT